MGPVFVSSQRPRTVSAPPVTSAFPRSPPTNIQPSVTLPPPPPISPPSHLTSPPSHLTALCLYHWWRSALQFTRYCILQTTCCHLVTVFRSSTVRVSAGRRYGRRGMSGSFGASLVFCLWLPLYLLMCWYRRRCRLVLVGKKVGASVFVFVFVWFTLL